MTDDVKFFLTLYGGIIAFVWMLIGLDWVSRRQERKADKQKPA